MPAFEFTLLYTNNYSFSIKGHSIDVTTIWKTLRKNPTFRCRKYQMHELAMDDHIEDFDSEKHSVWFQEGPHTFEQNGTECSVTAIDKKDNQSVVFTVYGPNSTDAENTFLSIMDDIFSNHMKMQPDLDKYIHIWNADDVSEDWNRTSLRSFRSFDTIYLPKDVKQELSKRIENFLGARKEYELFGMPYKLVGLLEGPPGTGKTSIIHALASKHEKDIAFLTITPKMKNTTLIKLFSRLPENCFLILEDVDSVFNAPDLFTTLVNILDGINIHEGMVVLITTNYRNKLEPALVRPGRVDFIIPFDYVKEPEIRTILAKFVPKRTTEFNAIVQTIKDYKFTVATLQKFLFEHRHDSTLLKPSTLAEFENLIQEYHKGVNNTLT